MMKKIAITLLIAPLMVGCHSSRPIQQAPQAVQVMRMEAQAGTTDGALRFSAVVTPDAEAPLSFRIPGYVVSLKQVRGQDGRMRDLAEGDRVSRGAVLVPFDRRNTRTRYGRHRPRRRRLKLSPRRQSSTSIAL